MNITQHILRSAISLLALMPWAPAYALEPVLPKKPVEEHETVVEKGLFRGKKGKQGKRGKRGKRGHRGHRGHTGHTGN